MPTDDEAADDKAQPVHSNSESRGNQDSTCPSPDPGRSSFTSLPRRWPSIVIRKGEVPHALTTARSRPNSRTSSGQATRITARNGRIHKSRQHRTPPFAGAHFYPPTDAVPPHCNHHSPSHIQIPITQPAGCHFFYYRHAYRFRFAISISLIHRPTAVFLGEAHTFSKG